MCCDSLKVWLVGLVPFAAVIGYGDVLKAQQETSAASDEQRTIQVNDGQTISSALPRRWSRIELAKDADDVIAVFRLSGERKSQIDIRRTALKGDEEIKSFLSSFYARLVERGFERVQRESLTIGETDGLFSRYRYRKKEFRHRLEIWHWKSEDTVWMVTAFLAGRRFEKYHRDVARFVRDFELN